MSNTFKLSSLFAVLALAGCVTVPTGPSVMVLPGTGKSFDQFRYDDGDCRQYAHAQVGGTTTAQAAEDTAVRGAVIGTAVGALAGAALGGTGRDAGVGAGVGLLAGSAMGAGAAQGSAYELQRRYDHAYQQCMYSKGHRIPTAARYAPSGRSTPPPPATSYPPPPPPSSSSQRPPPPPPQ
ncbi:MAG: hypothetical protein HY527_14160 [Betaproteobacteria bacterium]|nr:hypothetical protein [Betaproteobacteria bacterium]